MAAKMAADGDDTRALADEQAAYSDEIEAVTRLVWDEGMDVDEAVEQVLGSESGPVVARCVEPDCQCLARAGVIYGSRREVPTGYEID
jgi:hypothetical protein